MATKSMPKKPDTKTSARRTKVKELAVQLTGMRLLGEIITWNSRNDANRTHKQIVQALTESDLDAAVAREMQPRQAFTRASKKLADDRVIDVVREQNDDIVFQFTKKYMKAGEWVFNKELDLLLNKTTGKVTCSDSELEATAQQALDFAIDDRTTSDITKIVQKLFEKNADLFPIREQGGVYFVPQEHTAFIAKVEGFLGRIGGRIGRFPVPAGTQYGDKAVQESIAEALAQLVQDHETAVAGFTINTRKDTIESAADKIKATRVKVEAYANYLADRSAELLASVDTANEKLRAQINSLAEERAAMPIASENGESGRQLVFGYAVTAVIRWMGSMAWKLPRAKAVLHKRGISVADATINAQLLAGRKGQRGDPAQLTAAQAQELNDTLKDDGAEEAKPATEEKPAKAKKSKTELAIAKARKQLDKEYGEGNYLNGVLEDAAVALGGKKSIVRKLLGGPDSTK